MGKVAARDLLDRKDWPSSLNCVVQSALRAHTTHDTHSGTERPEGSESRAASR